MAKSTKKVAKKSNGAKKISSAELQKVIEKSRSDFDSLLRCEGYGDTKLTSKLGKALGAEVKFVESKRYLNSCDEQGYYWILKIGEQFFRWDGWYCSYEGADLDSVTEFEEVKQVKKIIHVWEEV